MPCKVVFTMAFDVEHGGGQAYKLVKHDEPQSKGRTLQLFTCRVGDNYEPASGGQWHYDIQGALDRISYCVAAAGAYTRGVLQQQVQRLHGEVASSDLNDRVRFTLPAYRLVKSDYRRLIKDCFGVDPTEYTTDEGLVLTCRIDQWGRFIIARNKCGVINNVKELKPYLITQEKPGELNQIDATGRPAQVIDSLYED